MRFVYQNMLLFRKTKNPKKHFRLFFFTLGFLWAFRVGFFVPTLIVTETKFEGTKNFNLKKLTERVLT